MFIILYLELGFSRTLWYHRLYSEVEGFLICQESQWARRRIVDGIADFSAGTRVTIRDIDFSSVTPQELKGRAILTVNNERSMEINNKVLEFMPGNETVYKAVMIMSEDE
ncbi:hypothetical protein AVEN_123242-1 [Araneus ventricosus]|uniref:Uncharacterized protein n=1 Tax=Araneus ventricosus TaxID=182803 RepID=A0A4Y2KSK4_ARAVE|nr:hypothetical protein AVEN_123242-1 [Araneus ventricosus]